MSGEWLEAFWWAGESDKPGHLPTFGESWAQRAITGKEGIGQESGGEE